MGTGRSEWRIVFLVDCSSFSYQWTSPPSGIRIESDGLRGTLLNIFMRVFQTWRTLKLPIEKTIDFLEVIMIITLCYISLCFDVFLLPFQSQIFARSLSPFLHRLTPGAVRKYLSSVGVLAQMHH
jgi:hypothetical protein